jgi:hypothetical protein
MSPPNVTNEIVAAQIRRLDEDLAVLDKQLSGLTQRKEAILMMKKVLQPLIAAKAHNPAAKAQKSSTVIQSGKAVTEAPSSVNTGFRSAVRGVIREHPKGLKPAELIKVLGERGELAKYTGKIKASDRVYSELWALKKSGAISKRHGRYLSNAESINGQT